MTLKPKAKSKNLYIRLYLRTKVSKSVIRDSLRIGLLDKIFLIL